MRWPRHAMATGARHLSQEPRIAPLPQQAGVTAECQAIRVEKEHAVTGYKATKRDVCMRFETTTNDNTVYNVLYFDDQRSDRDTIHDFAVFPK